MTETPPDLTAARRLVAALEEQRDEARLLTLESRRLRHGMTGLKESLSHTADTWTSALESLRKARATSLKTVALLEAADALGIGDD